MHAISERTVQRLVVKATGLTPKAYAAVLQFHRALRLLRDHRLSPASAALEAGFSDQAHMSRVFRRMGEFLAGATSRCHPRQFGRLMSDLFKIALEHGV